MISNFRVSIVADTPKLLSFGGRAIRESLTMMIYCERELRNK